MRLLRQLTPRRSPPSFPTFPHHTECLVLPRLLVFVRCRSRLYVREINEVLLAHREILTHVHRVFARQTVLRNSRAGTVKQVRRP